MLCMKAPNPVILLAVRLEEQFGRTVCESGPMKSKYPTHVTNKKQQLTTRTLLINIQCRTRYCVVGCTCGRFRECLDQLASGICRTLRRRRPLRVPLEISGRGKRRVEKKKKRLCVRKRESGPIPHTFATTITATATTTNTKTDDHHGQVR